MGNGKQSKGGGGGMNIPLRSGKQVPFSRDPVNRGDPLQSAWRL